MQQTYILGVLSLALALVRGVSPYDWRQGFMHNPESATLPDRGVQLRNFHPQSGHTQDPTVAVNWPATDKFHYRNIGNETSTITNCVAACCHPNPRTLVQQATKQATLAQRHLTPKRMSA